jgi:[ribosomal protein S18]-alanine N-acetyltransferase
MYEFTFIRNAEEAKAPFSKDAVADFLYEHLDEFGDKRSAIMNCINYALSDSEEKGGYIVLSHEKGKDEITGAVIMNRTGMKGYIPDNILVYIAVHKEHRGTGLGKKLMKEVLDNTEGDIALHVEPENPAKFLYEKFGFTNKYLEMRYIR